MATRTKITVLLMVCCVLAASAGAQDFRDGVRFATPGVGVGTRALGMGNAFTGVASDFSSLYWNPAGLAQLRQSEFAIGLSYGTNSNRATFFGNQQTADNNSTTLNALGVVYPVPVRRGSLVLGFGFNRNSDFTGGREFRGFNPSSSIIQTFAPDLQPVNGDPVGNIAWELLLADTARGRFESPIRNRVTQIGDEVLGGGLNNWSVGGGIDIARNLSLGLTLTFVSGTFRYDRTYRERDDARIYTDPINNKMYDMKEFSLEDFTDSDVSGVNAKLGLMYRVPDRFRFGITITTPSALNIREKFNRTARSSFYTPDRQGYTDYGPIEIETSTEYDLETPWIVGAGASVIVGDVMVAGDVDYIDWTQLEFSRANPDIIRENRAIKQNLRATANARLGAEYEVRDLGLRVRAGFIYDPSAIKNAMSSFDRKYVTGGLGIPLGLTAMLDVAYARGWWYETHQNYDETSILTERVHTNTFMVALTYRF